MAASRRLVFHALVLVELLSRDEPRATHRAAKLPSRRDRARQGVFGARALRGGCHAGSSYAGRLPSSWPDTRREAAALCVVRRQDLAATSRLARYAPGPFRYLEVGWGDGDYYPAKRGTIHLALRAAFRSRWAVLQVVGFDGSVPTTFPRAKILQVDLSLDGVASLARYIDATYAVDPYGRPIIVAPAEYGVGAFYLARGQYGLLNNSNTWAARGLEIAGCPIDIDTAVTAGAILHQTARFAHVLRAGLLLHGSHHPAMRCSAPGRSA